MHHVSKTLGIRFGIGLLLLHAAWGGPCSAGEWPQILGPHRNGQADGERLAATWPKEGPRTVWERPVGSGFAGVAVAQGKAILFHRQGDQELVEALDPKSGQLLWKAEFPTDYRATISEDDGPLCVPVIHQDRVFVFGAAGDLHAVSLAKGETLWSRRAGKEYGAPTGYFGFGSTPIVEGKRLLVNVGGDKRGAGIVAFDIDTGKTLWTTLKDQASYASPTAATIDGVRHVLFVTRLNAVSLDPENGQIRFQIPFGLRGPTVNGASPLVLEGNLFLSSSYGIGATFAKIGRDKADTLWESDDIMSSQYTTCVSQDGVLFGIDGRQDQGIARLRCFDPKTQRVQWTEPDFGMATLILADGKLISMKTNGELVLAAANPQKFQRLAAAKVFTQTTRALPALAGGFLYVRDTQTLKCLDLGKAP
jgi:outer membrane protein assembly factor BamB